VPEDGHQTGLISQRESLVGSNPSPATMKIIYKEYYDFEMEVADIPEGSKMINGRRLSNIWWVPYSDDWKEIIEKHNKAIDEINKQKDIIRECQQFKA
jgi:hypothetical protein